MLKLDIKWRAMLLTSILLLALMILVVWVSNHALMSQFQHSRQAFYERQRRAVQFNLQRSNDVMRQLASLTASSERLGQALSGEDPAEAEDAMSSLWPTLQLDAGLEDITLYDRNLRKLVTLGSQEKLAPKLLNLDWLSQVIQQEEPAAQLICRESCRQIVAVPVLVDGVDAGVIVTSRSLADVTRYIKESSGSEVALLVHEENAAGSRYLPEWSVNLLALTHQETLLPFIKSIASEFSFGEASERVLSVARGNRDYEVSTIPLQEGIVGEPQEGYFLLVSDVTSELGQIKSATTTILLISLIGWLAAEIILYLILRYRMGRLKDISRKLPLLAARQYAVMRSSIHPRKSLFVDEVDALELTALELEVKLEALENEVNKRGDELEARVRDLAHERDFITSLMNTVQVLVLSHVPQGKITLANQFAADVIGIDERKLKTMAFVEVFSDIGFEANNFLDEGGQQESRYVSPDGVTRTIVWYHTPFTSAGKQQELISVGVDITERKQAEVRLAWLANRDPLTELYNRRFFEEALERAVVPSASGALLYLDLDRFKDVNELSGHQSGDHLLRNVAGLLAEINQGSIVARLGGDEFAILMEYATSEEALERAQNIVEQLEQLSLYVDGRTHRAGGSIGVAIYPDHGQRPEELMANADYAMYKAKDDSARRWHLLLPEQQGREDLKQRVFWTETIRTALLSDRFELMLQPIFQLSDLRIQHYEALLRLREDDGSLLSPATFIPVAERSGQIVAIDRWVMAKGIELMSGLAGKSTDVAVNLSGQSLHDGTMVAFMSEQFEKYGVDPGRLIVEVTETAAVTDFTAARGVLGAIRELGCQVALDDFGVGFSSFYYLGQLPSDYIKIDGSFITSLAESEENQLIVKAIAEIARGLGKKTVAEFVDKELILSYLKTYNIDYAQGFYLGRPEPASNVLSK